MPRKKEIPLSLRDQAVGLFRAGKSNRQIATILNIHYSTIYYIIKKFRKTGSTTNITKTGRPKSLSFRSARHIKSNVKKHRTTCLRGITEIFNTGKKFSVSEKTVSRCLHNQGFYARRPCKKPFISARNRRKRLDYYRNCRLWKINDWKKLIFSDESKFNLFTFDGRAKVWRQAHERYLPECTKKTIKGFGGSIMFWGCITYDRMGPFIEIRGNLNGQEYISQILDPFRGFWRKFKKNKTAVFMQDNAPCHTSKIVEKWFGSNKVRKILWPPQSPDQNPIESVWDILLRTIRNRKKQPTSLTELREALKTGG